MATLTVRLKKTGGDKPLRTRMTVVVTTSDGTYLDSQTKTYLGGPKYLADGAEWSPIDLTGPGISPAGILYRLTVPETSPIGYREWYWDGHTDAALSDLPTSSVPIVDGPGLVQPYDDGPVVQRVQALEDDEVEWDEVGGKPTSFPPSDHDHPAQEVNWDDVADKPIEFPPSDHDHPASEITGLAEVATSGDYGDLSGKPTIPTTPGQVGADPAGTAGGLIADHVAAADPHGDRAYTADAVADEQARAIGVEAVKADLVAGKVPAAQLPAYVDDVIEAANFAALPGTGETGKLYVTLDDGKVWRWGGSAYVVVSDSLALGETSSTAYRGDRGKTAYDHSQVVSGNPHGTTLADLNAQRLVTLGKTEVGDLDTVLETGWYAASAATLHTPYSTYWNVGVIAYSYTGFETQIAYEVLATSVWKRQRNGGVWGAWVRLDNGALGTAASHAHTDYATAAQGTKADSAVQPTLADAKGDLFAASADNALGRLAVGANNTRLVPDSSQALGFRYSTGLIIEGNGSPEGVVTAAANSMYHQLDSGAGFTWWIKTAGSGNTNWRPLTSGDIGQAFGFASTASQSITADWLGRCWTLTLSANFTLSLGANPSSAMTGTVDLVLKQPASGGPYTVTWPSLATLPWAGGAAAPVMPTTAGAELNVVLKWTGAAWRAFLAGTF